MEVFKIVFHFLRIVMRDNVLCIFSYVNKMLFVFIKRKKKLESL